MSRSRERTSHRAAAFAVGAAIIALLASSGGARADSTGVWVEKAKLSGTFDGQLRVMRHASLSKDDAGLASDLYLRMIEIGVETSFSTRVSAIAVFNSEWLGDTRHQGDEQVTLEEVHVDLGREGSPFYLVLGKRTQPFGVFENHVVTDPITQDAYETNVVGATAGVRGAFDTDVSITVYKGDEMESHFFESGLFDTTGIRREPSSDDNVNSYIVSASVAPVKDVLTLFGAMIGESGRGGCSSCIGGEGGTTIANWGASFTVPFLRSLAFDLEVMRATRREEYLESNKGFLETVGAATVSYSFIPRENPLVSRGLYRARRAYRRTHPMVLAARFERYNDDGLGKWFGVWTIDHRWMAGGRYAFVEKRSIEVYGAAEYRATEYRLPPGARNLNGSNGEMYLSLGLDF